MGANDAQARADRAGRRRFITRTHVEDAAHSGSAVHVGGRDVVTDEAAQRAEDLGVRIVREQAAPARAADAPVPGGAAAAPAPDELRAAVRRAVVAELGHEPDGLAAAIDRAMKRRGH